MSYTKQNFSQGQVLTAEALNKMDEQIEKNDFGTYISAVDIPFVSVGVPNHYINPDVTAYLVSPETFPKKELLSTEEPFYIEVLNSSSGAKETFRLSEAIMYEESGYTQFSKAGASIYIVYDNSIASFGDSGIPSSNGIYFTNDSYSNASLNRLYREGVRRSIIDNKYIDLKNHPDFKIPSAPSVQTKLYKHSVYINSGNTGLWSDEAKIWLSYVSTSATPITTLAELVNSPAVVRNTSASALHYLNYAHATFHYADEQGGDRDVMYIMVSNTQIRIFYVTAYTVPVALENTSHENANYERVVITDTVTEV